MIHRTNRTSLEEVVKLFKHRNRTCTRVTKTQQNRTEPRKQNSTQKDVEEPPNKSKDASQQQLIRTQNRTSETPKTNNQYHLPTFLSRTKPKIKTTDTSKLNKQPFNYQWHQQTPTKQRNSESIHRLTSQEIEMTSKTSYRTALYT